MSRHKSRKSIKPRITARLNSTLERKLLGYAAVAGATSVGILALAQSVEAKIVFTPTHQILTGRVMIDVNGDGIADFTLSNFYGTSLHAVRRAPSFHNSFASVIVTPSRVENTAVGSTATPRNFAQALAPGANVGSQDQFVSNRLFMAYCGLRTGLVVQTGPWIQATNRFLGLKFVINGQTHYGWARLTVKYSAAMRLCQYKEVLTGYAYETIANKPIIAGRTTGPEGESAQLQTLGQLALGAELVAWRREQELAA